MQFPFHASDLEKNTSPGPSSTSYQRQEGTYIFYRKLMALAFLPAEHVTPVFDAIKVSIQSEFR